MTHNKRRLLKDLPFEGLTRGTVVWCGGRGHGGKYSVSRGHTFYVGGTGSDRGIVTFEPPVEEIISLVWDDPLWFEDATLKHVEVIPKTEGIILRFQSIDIEDAEEFAQGLIHILPEMGKGSWVWNKFIDITTEMKNH